MPFGLQPVCVSTAVHQVGVQFSFWTSQNVFHRLGRAMLVPLYTQQHKQGKHSGLSKSLRLCLEWWRQVLSLQLKQTKKFRCEASKPVHLFADARGFPARLAAVLLVDGELFYVDCEPPESMEKVFRGRQDNQIMGWELFAIALGLSSFSHLLRHRHVTVWSDDVGSERATAKGKAKQWDHTCVVHCLWLMAAKLGITMWIERVPTDDNIADLPSREQ